MLITWKQANDGQEEMARNKDPLAGEGQRDETPAMLTNQAYEEHLAPPLTAGGSSLAEGVSR